MKPTYKQVTKTRYIEQISQLAEEIFCSALHQADPKSSPRPGGKVPE